MSVTTDGSAVKISVDTSADLQSLLEQLRGPLPSLSMAVWVIFNRRLCGFNYRESKAQSHPCSPGVGVQLVSRKLRSRLEPLRQPRLGGLFMSNRSTTQVRLKVSHKAAVDTILGVCEASQVSWLDEPI
jgi:hypothetical protein